MSEYVCVLLSAFTAEPFIITLKLKTTQKPCDTAEKFVHYVHHNKIDEFYKTQC